MLKPFCVSTSLCLHNPWPATAWVQAMLCYACATSMPMQCSSITKLRERISHLAMMSAPPSSQLAAQQVVVAVHVLVHGALGCRARRTGRPPQAWEMHGRVARPPSALAAVDELVLQGPRLAKGVCRHAPRVLRRQQERAPASKCGGSGMRPAEQLTQCGAHVSRECRQQVASLHRSTKDVT